MIVPINSADFTFFIPVQVYSNPFSLVKTVDRTS